MASIRLEPVGGGWLIYCDDKLVPGRNWEEMVENLRCMHGIKILKYTGREEKISYSVSAPVSTQTLTEIAGNAATKIKQDDKHWYKKYMPNKGRF